MASKYWQQQYWKKPHALPGAKQKEVENIVQTLRKYTVELGKTEAVNFSLGIPNLYLAILLLF